MIVVDKPAGWTSHDVVNRMRRIANTRKVGHLGTLDPMATGVLPILVGKATRLAQFFGTKGKVYEATVRFGWSTNTYDAEGVATSPETPVVLESAELDRHLDSFRGEISQVPPPVSAKKIAGTPAYKLARKNIEVKLEPVLVSIEKLELLRCEGSEADLRITCGTGTYIRSIAHDLGVALGCGAHLSKLRRTASSGFQASEASSLETLQVLGEQGKLDQVLISGKQLLQDMPAELVDDGAVTGIRQGRAFRGSPFGLTRGAKLVRALSYSGELIAIGEERMPLVYHPILVL